MVPHKSTRCYSHSLPLGGWSGGSWGLPGEQRSVKVLSASVDSAVQKPHCVVNYAIHFSSLAKNSEVSFWGLPKPIWCAVLEKRKVGWWWWGVGVGGHSVLYLTMQMAWLRGKYSINLFLIPTLFSHAGLTPPLPATPWRRHCGQSSRTTRWNSAHPFPLSLALHPSRHPSSPPTGQGEVALLLSMALHKCPERSDEEQGGKFLSEKLSQVYIICK